MAAAGASYGGYMMNWFQGHTDKFKTLVTHSGVYGFVSMYGTTEETWFDEWDRGIPWENSDFEKWSPHKHAAKFKTPNLNIHNALDFRVPLNQGLSLFTTLQRKGVPSKLLYFPDEGHWVLKPQISELWQTPIFERLDGYLKKQGRRRRSAGEGPQVYACGYGAGWIKTSGPRRRWRASRSCCCLPRIGGRTDRRPAGGR